MNRKLYSLAGYLVALFLQQTETKTYKNDASKSNFKVPLVRSNCKPTYIYFVLALHSLRRKWKKSERWGGDIKERVIIISLCKEGNAQFTTVPLSSIT